MAKTKTTYTGQNVIDFVNSYVENEQKRQTVSTHQFISFKGTLHRINKIH